MSVQESIDKFIDETGSKVASYVDACIHCGLCAEACHYYKASDNPRYTPVLKWKPISDTYKRSKDPLRFIKKLFLGSSSTVTEEVLKDWQDLVFDSCSMCGRCTLVCPMGIDTAYMVQIMREGMAKAGLVPDVILQLAHAAKESGSPMGVDPQKLKTLLARLEQENDVVLPLDKPKADVLLLDSSLDFAQYQGTLVAMGKILNSVGIDWTFSSKGYEASNLGLFSGEEDVAEAMVSRIAEAAEEVGAKLVLAPECGHGYGSIRWEAPNILKRELPFEVLHITEYLARLYREGKLKISQTDQPLTYHDPCKLGRRGGVLDEPRDIMRDLSSDFREMEPSGVANWCCGGGGGVVLLESARELQLASFKIKMKQVEETGADGVVMSCAFCHHTFDSSAQHFDWDTQIVDMVQLVAKQMLPTDHLVQKHENKESVDSSKNNSPVQNTQTSVVTSSTVGNNAEDEQGEVAKSIDNRQTATDNLKKIEGIGPKIESLLNEAGISTYTDLKNTDAETLKQLLAQAGSQFRLHNPESWPQQAALAAKGDWDGLNQLQNQLLGLKKT